MDIARSPSYSSSSSLSPLKFQQQQPRSGNCFNCKSPGHWVKDCPLKRNQTQVCAPREEKPRDARVFPDMLCPNRDAFCITKTSHSDSNPDRKYYQCPACGCTKSSGIVDGFMWCDLLLNRALDNFEHRKCPCGAGWCNRMKLDVGVNAGKEYFVCPNRKGSCHHVQVCNQFTCIRPGFPETYPLCPCRAGRSRLYIDNNFGRFRLGCTVLEGQGACSFIQWLDSDSGEHGTAAERSSFEKSIASVEGGNGDGSERFEQTSLYMSDGPCPTEATTIVDRGKFAARSPSSSLDGDDVKIIDLFLSRLEANSSDSSVCSYSPYQHHRGEN